ncbi:P-type conjugative transfer protein TrbG [Sphingomonas bacterium]|uniref:P-type conjugative transfer protein TrbG n=1 Tax=Sphingomonas bacterium TaxID=1895847 RepID=UPI001575CBBE|nr:P-type conjugative transfer protein TrbG [Sphingomonas bacterium]
MTISIQTRLIAPACALAVASAAAAAIPPTVASPTTVVTSRAAAPAPQAWPAIPLVTPRKHRTARSHRAPVATTSLRTVSAANRAATLEPDRQAFINAVQIYPYADGVLYHVYTAPERVTDIALQPGEVLGAVASGDTVRWTIGDTTSGAGDSRQTHILVKPFAAGLATNLVVTTDRRSYHLALTSTAASAMAALSWTYPQDQLIALKHAAEQVRAAAPVAAGLSLEQLRFNYAVTGDEPTWRPLRAFDDGRQTFIEFPVSIAVGEAPPLFLVDAKGAAQLVNYRVQGRFYVVDRIFDAAELRLGSKHQDVVRITRIADEPVRRRGA